MKLNIKFSSTLSNLIYQNGQLLQYQTPGSSGFDLRAISIYDPYLKENFALDCTEELNKNNENLFDNYINKFKKISKYVLMPNKRALIHTGFSISISSIHEIQIRPRSGLALKNGIMIVNTPGTIDSDYRGEIGALLYNSSDEPFEIILGDRIAQAIVSNVTKLNIHFVSNLDSTDRGNDGFGSTGLK